MGAEAAPAHAPSGSATGEFWEPSGRPSGDMADTAAEGARRRGLSAASAALAAELWPRAALPSRRAPYVIQLPSVVPGQVS